MKIPTSWQRFIPPNWRNKGHRLLRDVVAMFSAFRNHDVPWSAKALTLASVVYVIMPFDIIPDMIPVIGYADDVAVIPLACYFASRMVPKGVMEKLRDNAEYTLLRWGPKFKIFVVGFVLMWLFLAVMGGCFFMRDRSGRAKELRTGSNAGTVDWERHLTREIMRRPED